MKITLITQDEMTANERANANLGTVASGYISNKEGDLIGTDYCYQTPLSSCYPEEQRNKLIDSVIGAVELRSFQDKITHALRAVGVTPYEWARLLEYHTVSRDLEAGWVPPEWFVDPNVSPTKLPGVAAVLHSLCWNEWWKPEKLDYIRHVRPLAYVVSGAAGNPLDQCPLWQETKQLGDNPHVLSRTVHMYAQLLISIMMGIPLVRYNEPYPIDAKFPCTDVNCKDLNGRYDSDDKAEWARNNLSWIRQNLTEEYYFPKPLNFDPSTKNSLPVYRYWVHDAIDSQTEVKKFCRLAQRMTSSNTMASSETIKFENLNFTYER